MIEPGDLRRHSKALNSNEDTSRRQAIQALRSYEEQEWATVAPDAIHTLVDSLGRQLVDGSKQTSNRQQILVILGNIGPSSEPAIPAIIELLQEGVADGVREEAATALGKIGKKAKIAVEHLVKILPHCRTSLAVRVIKALSSIGGADKKVRNALVDLWLAPDQSHDNQLQIALSLCKLKIETKGLVKFLTGMLVTKQNSSLRESAAEALGWCRKNDIDVAPALLDATLNDKDDKVRQVAEASLSRLGLSQKKAIQLCAKQLKDSLYAEATLRKSGELAVPVLIEAVGSAEPLIREKAIRVISSLGELAAEAAPAITGALQDDDMQIRLRAAKALWNITKNAELAVPVLADLLEEKWTDIGDSGESRRRFLQTVIEALRRIGPPAKAAIPGLIKKTKDKNRNVSESARSAVEMIDSDNALSSAG